MKLIKKIGIGVVVFFTTVIILLYVFNVDYLIRAVKTI